MASGGPGLGVVVDASVLTRSGKSGNCCGRRVREEKGGVMSGLYVSHHDANNYGGMISYVFDRRNMERTVSEEHLECKVCNEHVLLTSS